MPYVIELFKENFKFSCTHFTIFGAQSAERLHGHNYQARVRLEFDAVQPDLGLAFDFNVVKREIKALCDELDEYVLVAGRSPYLSVAEKSGQTDFVFAGKRYSMPSTDVRILPVANITVEELARHIAESLAARLREAQAPGEADFSSLRGLAVAIEETRGQSVSYELKLS